MMLTSVVVALITVSLRVAIAQEAPSKGYIDATFNDASKVTLSVGVRQTGDRSITAPDL